MSNATLIEIVSSNGSAQVAALDALGGGEAPTSLFNVSFRAVSNFALEHVECTLQTKPTGVRAGQKATFQVSKAGDLASSCWLQVSLPAIKASVTGGIATYVHNVGFALIQYLQFQVSNHSQQDIPGQWLEIDEELNQPAGRRLQECIFKHDGITLPEMAELSGKGLELFVPLPFWWCNVHSALPLITMNCHDLDVVVGLKGIEDLTVSMHPQMNDPCSVVKVSDSAALTWSDIDLRLWLGTVYLDSDEREQQSQLGDEGRQYLMKDVHSYTSYSQDEGTVLPDQSALILNNIPFNHPVSALYWVVADKYRRARYAKVHTPADGSATTAGGHATGGVPFTHGVRSLYGPLASTTAGVTDAELAAAGNAAGVWTDWNVIRDGAQTLETIATGGTPANVNVLSSAGVKEHRNDCQNNALHLPGDVFDFRLTDTTVTASATQRPVEIEPLSAVRIKFNSANRVSEQLHPAYYRTVQPLERFHNVPKKGISCYSFSANGSSPFPNSVVNFSRIDDISLEFTKNSKHTNSLTEGAGVATTAELYLYASYFQVFSVKRQSVGKLFGA